MTKIDRLLELENKLQKLDSCMYAERYDLTKEHQSLKKELEEKVDMWDKYSRQLETALQIYNDATTIREFLVNHRLPNFLNIVDKELTDLKTTLMSTAESCGEHIEKRIEAEHERDKFKEILDAISKINLSRVMTGKDSVYDMGVVRHMMREFVDAINTYEKYYKNEPSYIHSFDQVEPITSKMMRDEITDLDYKLDQLKEKIEHDWYAHIIEWLEDNKVYDDTKVYSVYDYYRNLKTIFEGLVTLCNEGRKCVICERIEEAQKNNPKIHGCYHHVCPTYEVKE